MMDFRHTPHGVHAKCGSSSHQVEQPPVVRYSVMLMLMLMLASHHYHAPIPLGVRQPAFAPGPATGAIQAGLASFARFYFVVREFRSQDLEQGRGESGGGQIWGLALWSLLDRRHRSSTVV